MIKRHLKAGLFLVLPVLWLASCSAAKQRGAAAHPEFDRAALISQARSLVAGLDGLFQKLFPTTGLSSYEEFYGSLNENRPAPAREFQDMILNENVQVGIHAREEVRAAIARSGFLNIHGTGTSSFEEKETGRNAVEAGCLGMGLKEYSALSPYLKPKYALLLPPMDSSLNGPDISKWYGTDIYVIKLDNIRDRLSWAPGDSLDRIDKWSAPKGINWRSGETFYPDSWDLAFIPWKRRALIVPLMEEDIKVTGKLSFTSTTQHPYYNLPAGKFAVKTAHPGPNSKYLELQIWGPLDMDDVEKFIFKNNPPAEEFLKTLKEHGIRIYDGRTEKPVKWSSIRLYRPEFAFLLSVPAVLHPGVPCAGFCAA